MKITKIEVQVKNPDRFSIYIDDKFAFGITDELQYKYNLKKGTILSQELMDEILEEEAQNKAINYTLHLLSYRQRSVEEVRRKLIEKEYLDHQIEYAIESCLKNRYLDDYEFASSYVRDKAKINKHGPQRIRHDLRFKGVDDDIIAQALEDNYENEYDIAFELASKQVEKYRNDDKQKRYRKLAGFLQRRGYSYDIVNSILRELV